MWGSIDFLTLMWYKGYIMKIPSIERPPPVCILPRDGLSEMGTISWIPNASSPPSSSKVPHISQNQIWRQIWSGISSDVRSDFWLILMLNLTSDLMSELIQDTIWRQNWSQIRSDVRTDPKSDLTSDLIWRRKIHTLPPPFYLSQISRRGGGSARNSTDNSFRP